MEKKNERVELLRELVKTVYDGDKEKATEIKETINLMDFLANLDGDSIPQPGDEERFGKVFYSWLMKTSEQDGKIQ